LIKLKTNYRMIFDAHKVIDIDQNMTKNLKQFESIEKGSGKKIKKYLSKSKSLYDFSLKHIAYKNHDSWFDILNFPYIRIALSVPIFARLEDLVSSCTTNKQIQKTLLYASLFIGNAPRYIPALYSAVANIDSHTGVYYPRGGTHQIVQALKALCDTYGVTIKPKTPVQKIITKGECAQSVLARNKRYNADYII